MHPTRWMCRLALSLALCVSPVLAQNDPASSEEAADEEMQEIDEVIVVTASRTEQSLHEVPAAVTVLTSEQLEQIPADDFGDYIRNVPGLNVSQMSARDIQISGRQATSSLATSELVLMDGRTLYLDFFGFVMWDYVPLDAKEIKQIEIVRGPGSAVWGANAMSGVINLITKSPREMQGTNITLGAGDFSTLLGSFTHAGVSGKVGYKVSAAYFEQDPYERPIGTIPGTEGPTNPGGTPYPDFENQGTRQPKLNFRLDYDQEEDTTWSFSGGWADTDGIMHSGIGPFDISSGSTMSFVKADWMRRAARATLFANLLDGDATNLLTRGIDGRPISFDFKSDTFNLDFSNTTVAGAHHILTYGATARRNNFDLSIAPRGDKREEYGFFFQDEVLLGDSGRWLIGARWDDIDPIGSVVSPRTSLIYSPSRNSAFRVSYNRAFRAPSMINNFLDIIIVGLAPLPTGPFAFPVRALGNPELTEERLDAIEIGYVGSFEKTTFTLSVYRNETKDSADFFPATAYTAANPPPGFPLPAFLLDVPPPFGLRGLLTSSFSYRNIGEIVDQGAEVTLNIRPAPAWSVFLNYSYQEEPETTGIEQVTLPDGTTRDAINTPPEHRANFGLAFDGSRFFANANVNFVDEAFWTDVLNETFWGPTDSYTQLNIGGGIHLGDRATVSVTGQNILDEDVQQHVFGDLIGRKLSGQVTFRF